MKNVFWIATIVLICSCQPLQIVPTRNDMIDVQVLKSMVRDSSQALYYRCDIKSILKPNGEELMTAELAIDVEFDIYPGYLLVMRQRDYVIPARYYNESVYLGLDGNGKPIKFTMYRDFIWVLDGNGLNTIAYIRKNKRT